jgi:hypothetical protein
MVVQRSRNKRDQQSTKAVFVCGTNNQDDLYLVIPVVDALCFVAAFVETVCFPLYQMFVLDLYDGIFVNAVEVPVRDVHLLEEVVPYTNRLTFCLCHLCCFIVLSVFTVSFCKGEKHSCGCEDYVWTARSSRI